MKRLYFILCMLLVGITQQLDAQRVDAALKELSAAFPQEKVYIHFDKDFYVAGQTIWFKSYLYSNWKPSGWSNNFYLQLLNADGQEILSKQYPIIGASVKGSLDLPDTLVQGNYFVRAYTPTMMNYDEQFIYRKKIPVYAANKPANASTSEATPNLLFQFFPESGELVDNILSILAFKATDEKGFPVAVKGMIKMLDGANATNIAPFATAHDGIGKMQIKTRAGKKYVAEIETPGGIKTVPLPEVKAIGLNLKVTDEKGGKRFLISRTVKDIKQYGNIMVVADMNNMVVYKTDINMEDYPSVEGHIVTSSLPSGIIHFTIFDSNGLPIAERLAFVNNREYIGSGEINTVTANLDKRAGNEIELKFPDSTLRSCSISITDDAVSENSDNENIYSRLLLTSDLKGYVHNPGWYFNPKNDSADVALDNLMLTHGWSKFNWEKVLARQYPEKKYGDPAMITVGGQVFDAKTNVPVANGNLNILIELGGKPKSYSIPVDGAGHFALDSLAFYGETKVYFDYADKQGKDKPITVKLEQNQDHEKLFARTRTMPLELNEQEKIPYVFPAVLDETGMATAGNNPGDTAKALETAVVKTKIEKEKRPIEMLNEKYTKGLFTQPARSFIDNYTTPSADQNIDAIRFIANRITQVQYVDGVFYSKHKTTLQLADWSQNFSKSTNALTEGKEIGTFDPLIPQTKASKNVVSGYPVLLYLNEVQVESGQLKGLSAKDIAFVKYFENFAGGGIGNLGGAIAVYTVDDKYQPKSPADYPEYALKAVGYSITKEFFNPDYADPEFKQPESDNRTTLYWNPSIMLGGGNNSVKLKFFNNDFSNKIRVVLEGFDAQGKLIHVEKRISR